MRIKQILFFVAFVVIAILLIIQFGQFQEFLAIVKQVNLLILLGVLVLRALYYLANTKYLQTYLRIFHHRPAFGELFKSILVVNFADSVFPSGGVSGIAVLRGSLRKYGISPHTSTVAQVFYRAFTGLSYIVLLVGSLVFLFFSQNIEMVSFRLILVALLVMLVVSFLILGLLINKKISYRFAFWLTRPLNWGLKRIKKNSLSQQQLNQLLDRLYSSIAEFKNDWKKLLKPFSWTFISLVIDVGSLYMVFVALGEFPNPGVVSAAFIIAMSISIFSVFTSGVGVFELGLVSVLVALGLSFDVSFPASIIYRIIAFWLFIPIGLFFYKRTLVDED